VHVSITLLYVEHFETEESFSSQLAYTYVVYLTFMVILYFLQCLCSEIDNRSVT